MTTREFGLAWKLGKTLYRGDTVELRRLVKGWDVPKLAVVVSKKTARLAVNRNRMRRVVVDRLKEAVLAQVDSYIVIVRSVDEAKVNKELEKVVQVVTRKV